jgi:Tol biopolymer transport system component
MRIVALTLVFAVASTALVSFSNRDSEAAWPGTNGKIAYHVSPDYGIWVMDADGSNRTRLTTGFDYEPSWSPDGTKIAFHRSAGIGRIAAGGGTSSLIMTMNADGSNPTAIGPGLSPSWSPDGTRIVYVIEGEIHEMDLDGSDDVAVTQGNQDDNPAYRPDGSVIAFQRYLTGAGVAGFGNTDIFVVKPDGSNVTPVTQTANLAEHDPDWAPDGSALVYSLEGDIWKTGYPGGGASKLVASPVDSQFEQPAYSPDGLHITFTQGMEGNPGPDFIWVLWMMNADGSGSFKITNGNNSSLSELRPDWQPTGVTLPTPTPSPASSPTPTGTAQPTETASPTPYPTGTVVIEDLVWADAQCDEEVNPIDSLLTLRYDAGIKSAQTPCPGFGAEVEVLGIGASGLGEGDGDPQLWGDADCSTEINPVDSLKILRHDASLPVSQEEGCPPIGSDVMIQRLVVGK